MKMMLCVLGEGRGHMTQAMAVKEMAEAAGHQVVSVVLGVGTRRQVPAYFASAMKMDVTLLPTLEFIYKNNRAVDMAATAASVIRNLPAYWRSLQKLDQLVRDTQPDVILNFFEPLAGCYALTRWKRPPVVAIAHQFMFGHPGYVRTPQLWKQQLSMKIYVAIIGACSTKLALSLYEAPDLPEKNLFVGPPILRKQLFELQSNPNGQFALVYLLNHGYAEQIIKWSDANPQTKLHCFYDKPDAPVEFQHSPSLTLHRLDGEKFLRMMAECRHVVCTAGFESVAEAAWLGKPLFLVPVENHVEQQVNAIGAVQAGLGVTDSSFNLDRLAELPDALPTGQFHEWINRAGKIFSAVINHARRNVTSLVLMFTFAFAAGCASLPEQTEVEWETFADDQRVWPVDDYGILHFTDGMPVYDLAQLPPKKYSVIGFIHVRTVGALNQSCAFDERLVVEQARKKQGQAVLLMKKPAPASHPRLQQSDYLVVKFEKDPLQAALELTDYFLSWSANNTSGYTSADGSIRLTAQEIITRRIELETQRKLILSRLNSNQATNTLTK